MRTKFVKGKVFPKFETVRDVGMVVDCTTQTIAGMTDTEYETYRNRIQKCFTDVAPVDGNANTGDFLNRVYAEFVDEPALLFLAGTDIGTYSGIHMSEKKYEPVINGLHEQSNHIQAELLRLKSQCRELESKIKNNR
jgi:hypothetical protein